MRRTVLLFFSALALAAPAISKPASGQDARPIGVVPRETALPGADGNWGIFIGVNRFDSSVPALQFCVEDARALRETLTGPGALLPSAQSYLLTSESERDNRPTRVNILKTIKYVCERASENSLIVIFIATHGFDGPGGKSYILPQDGDPNLLEDTAIPVERINQFMAASRAPRKILIVDACREKTGSETRGAASAAMSSSFQRSLQSSAGQIVLAACGEGQVAHEDAAANHGVFTRYLLDGLRGAAEPNAEGFISVYTLSQYTAGKTREWCSINRKPLQTPWLSGSISLDIPLAIRSRTAAVEMRPAPKPAPAETPAPKAPPPRPVDPFQPGETRTLDLGNGVTLELVYVPSGGVYLENASAGLSLVKQYGGTMAPSREQFGLRAVQIEGFWMGKHETTNAQYRRFRPSHSSSSYQRLSLDGDTQPAVHVSWKDALDFCDWLNRQANANSAARMTFNLPTVSQWEYACRGGNVSRECHWDHEQEAGKYANTFDLTAKTDFRLSRPEMPTTDGYVVSAPVGMFQPNAFGLHDMLGNVWEWCVDLNGKPIPDRVGGNPFRGLNAGAFVVRGGSWDSAPALCRVSYPSGYCPTSSLFSRGFRVCGK